MKFIDNEMKAVKDYEIYFFYFKKKQLIGLF